MSNIIRNLQKRRNGTKNNKEIMNQIKANKSMSKTVDFGDRILPRTFLVDVKTGSIKLGNETDKLNTIEPFITVDNDPEVIAGLIAILSKHCEDKDIDKVILDNQTDFKIQSIEEFRDNVIKYNDSLTTPKAEPIDGNNE